MLEKYTGETMVKKVVFLVFLMEIWEGKMFMRRLKY